jgi:hypothetical protein
MESSVAITGFTFRPVAKPISSMAGTSDLHLAGHALEHLRRDLQLGQAHVLDLALQPQEFGQGFVVHEPHLLQGGPDPSPPLLLMAQCALQLDGGDDPGFHQQFADAFAVGH